MTGGKGGRKKNETPRVRCQTRCRPDMAYFLRYYRPTPNSKPPANRSRAHRKKGGKRQLHPGKQRGGGHFILTLLAKGGEGGISSPKEKNHSSPPKVCPFFHTPFNYFTLICHRQRPDHRRKGKGRPSREQGRQVPAIAAPGLHLRFRARGKKGGEKGRCIMCSLFLRFTRDISRHAERKGNKEGRKRERNCEPEKNTSWPTNFSTFFPVGAPGWERGRDPQKQGESTCPDCRPSSLSTSTATRTRKALQPSFPFHFMLLREGEREKKGIRRILRHRFRRYFQFFLFLSEAEKGEKKPPRGSQGLSSFVVGVREKGRERSSLFVRAR